MSAFDTTRLRTDLLNSNPASPAYFEMGFDKVPRIFSDSDAGLKAVRESISKARKIRPQKWEDNFKDFSLRCMGSDLPTRQIETQERRYAGPQRLIPYGTLYSNLNLELIEGKNLRMREFIDFWMDFINGERFDNGAIRSPRPLYYDDIIADMWLKVYDKSGNVVRKYTFRDVFPITVAPSQMSWANENSFLVIPVEFAYYDFVAESKWDNSKQIGSSL